MLIQSSPLADRIASLRAATEAKPERGWLPSALHAMIAAIFGRIFDRLEQFILLWQSGQLPPPPIRRATAPRTADCAVHPDLAPERRSRESRPAQRPVRSRIRARTAIPRSAPTPRMPAKIVPPARPRIRPGRAPPRPT